MANQNNSGFTEDTQETALQCADLFPKELDVALDSFDTIALLLELHTLAERMAANLKDIHDTAVADGLSTLFTEHLLSDWEATSAKTQEYLRARFSQS